MIDDANLTSLLYQSLLYQLYPHLPYINDQQLDILILQVQLLKPWNLKYFFDQLVLHFLELFDENISLYFFTNLFTHLPVDPKPPEPLTVSGRSSVSSKLIFKIGIRTICAILSLFFTSKILSP